MSVKDKEKIGIYIVAKFLNKEIFRKMHNLFKDKKLKIVTTPEVIKAINPDEWQNFLFINENDILNKLFIEEKINILGNVGWYYQQFLKYKIVLTAPEEDVHIIDGDSILNPSLSKPMMLATTGRVSYNKYSNFSKIALGDYCKKYSFVTNQMVFNKKILREMLDFIENHNEKNWMDISVDIMKDNKDSIFSEYQLYGNYIYLRKKIKPTHIKVFRRMDCVKSSITKALEKYELVAYEPQHATGALRIIRANILYRLGISLG